MDQLSRGSKIVYSLGKGAEAIDSRLFEFFLFFYFTQVLGLSGTLSGLAVAMSLVFDAITDPLIGSLSDRRNSKMGRRHPFMYLSILPVGIAINLLYNPPQGLGQVGLFLWLLIFAVSLRIAITVFFVPYLALGAELSQDYYERTTIVAYRGVSGIVGSACAMVFGLLVFLPSTEKYPKGQMNPAGYAPFAFTCSIIMMGLILVTVQGTRHHIPHLPKAPPNPPRYRFTQLFKEMASVFTNRSFSAIFLAGITLAVSAGIQATLLMHYLTFYWELESRQIVHFTWVIALGFLLCIPFIRQFHVWFDKKTTFLVGLIMGSLLGCVSVLLREAGLFFDNGDPRLLPALLCQYGLISFLLAMSALTGASMMADIADEHEVTTGLRQEGIFFGAISFSGKTASGLGHFIAGIAVDLIALPKGADVDAATITPGVISQLGLFNGPGMLIFSILGVLAILPYNLNHDRYKEIIANLNSRRLIKSEMQPVSSAQETRLSHSS